MRLYQDNSQSPPVELLIEIAESQLNDDDQIRAKALFKFALNQEGLERSDILRVLDGLERLKAEPGDLFSEVPWLNRLDVMSVVIITEKMQASRSWQKVAAKLLLSSTKGSDDSRDLYALDNQICLTLIGLGRFEEAAQAITKNRRLMNVQQWNVAEAFNLAMADWGVSKNPSSELFERVVRLDADDRFKIDSPNYHQCISLALFLAGEQEKAKSRLATARLALERKVLSSFSCWRYLALPPNELLEDLRSMQMYFDGIGEGPPVIYLQESQEN